VFVDHGPSKVKLGVSVIVEERVDPGVTGGERVVVVEGAVVEVGKLIGVLVTALEVAPET
jgi:hypothetical protein